MEKQVWSAKPHTILWGEMIGKRVMSERAEYIKREGKIFNLYVKPEVLQKGLQIG